MRLRAPSLALIQIVFAVALYSQQPATPTALLTESLSAMAGAMTKSISLSGTVQYTAGTTDEHGSFSAQCAVDGSSRLQLQIPSFSRTETRSNSSGAPSGTWVDDNGESHAMAGHNVMTPAAWFCPTILISEVLSNSALDVEYLGQESREEQSVDHLYVSSRPIDTSNVQQWMASLTRTDIFLDSETLRPVAIEFSLHPDNNAAINIPVEIRFSGYTNSSGVWLPSIVEKDVNSLPILRLTIDSSAPSPQLSGGN